MSVPVLIVLIKASNVYVIKRQREVKQHYISLRKEKLAYLTIKMSSKTKG